VDPNPTSVAVARERGLEALTGAEFARSPHARPGAFDALLCAHVLEHMELAQAVALVGEYLPFVRPGGKVVLITPQEAGFASDPTHVAFTGPAELARVLAGNGLVPERSYSFPFPRMAGRVFPHNEFIVVARVPVSA
jgi:2-polyprenyl-3-methyl-5-hydroxy-6-metoxy-1,4-benzoquinol methylase